MQRLHRRLTRRANESGSTGRTKALDRRATSAARLPGTLVNAEMFQEGTGCSIGPTVSHEGRALVADRLAQCRFDRAEEPTNLIGIEAAGFGKRVNVCRMMLHVSGSTSA